jgi:transcriptional regulator with XRE-family HTH domain
MAAVLATRWKLQGRNALASAKARKIQELREARGLSTGEVSHRLGIDEATVRRWESGEEEVGEGALSQLADTLGVSQDALRHAGDEEHHPDR